MKHSWKNRRLGAGVATLGTVLALAGTGLALAETQGAEPAGISPVIGKSWVDWAQSPEPAQQWTLPPASPQYSQVNFLSNPLDSGGQINTAQLGRVMQANASVLLRKASGPDAVVKCDLRMDGLEGSNEYITTIQGWGETRLTMPLVGSRKDIPAGTHNVGIRCSATGNTVVMEKADLTAVIYGASVPG